MSVSPEFVGIRRLREADRRDVRVMVAVDPGGPHHDGLAKDDCKKDMRKVISRHSTGLRIQGGNSEILANFRPKILGKLSIVDHFAQLLHFATGWAI